LWSKQLMTKYLCKPIRSGSPLSKLLLLQTVCLSPDFKESGIRIYAAILKAHSTKTGKCFCSEEKIAVAVHRSVRQVRRYIRKFQDQGWLTVIRHYKPNYKADGYYNEYQFPWQRGLTTTKNDVDEDTQDVRINEGLMRTKNEVDEDINRGVMRTKNEVDEDTLDVRYTICIPNEFLNELYSESEKENDSIDGRVAEEAGSNSHSSNMGSAPATISQEKDRKPAPASILQTKELVPAAPSAPAARLGPDDQFEHFWSIYPRQEGKEEARAEFLIAIDCGIAATTIITKAADYSRQCARERREPRYIKLAVTWLRKKCWTDNYASMPDPNPYAEEDAQYPPPPAGIKPDVWRGIQRAFHNKVN
jgi:hypothetical protein